MKASELRDKSAEELKAELENLRREQFNLRMAMGSGQGVKTHRVREVRRDIARIKTVITEMNKAGA